MTTTAVIIRDEGGGSLFTFNPMPSDVSFRMDNSPGKSPMDLPSYHRPTLFWMTSQNRRLTIKAAILRSEFSGSTMVDQLSDLFYIMSGSASDYLAIQIPVGLEDMTSSPHSYSTSDNAKDNAAFATGNNYIEFFCHPDELSIDKIGVNLVYVTLSYSEVDDVVSIG